MRYILSIILLLLCLTGRSKAQTGGDNTYEFLNLSTNALVSSLGGMNVSLASDDPSVATYNPALLGSNAAGNISLNYVNYLSGINYGYASYAVHHKQYGTFSAGINYLNYGKFDRTDPAGQLTGSFSASEHAINLLWSYRIDTLFNIGVNIKPVISHLESYSSVGILMDIGGLYTSRNGLYSAGLTVRNMGTQLSSYSGVRERMPFEIVAGATARLQHAPFRFSLTGRHLHKYRLIHDAELSDNTGTERFTGLGGIAENIMRHMIFSVEFIPSENFFVSTSYNYLRGKEMMVDARTSTTGFSMGAGIKLSRFELSFSRSRYHLAGSLSNISLLVKPGLYTRRN